MLTISEELRMAADQLRVVLSYDKETQLCFLSVDRFRQKCTTIGFNGLLEVIKAATHTLRLQKTDVDIELIFRSEADHGTAQIWSSLAFKSYKNLAELMTSFETDFQEFAVAIPLIKSLVSLFASFK